MLLTATAQSRDLRAEMQEVALLSPADYQRKVYVMLQNLCFLLFSETHVSGGKRVTLKKGECHG
jgi:hypothetical protein